MKILPVLDLQDGQVVHAVAGQRSQYRPLRSVWTESSRPEVVAEAIRKEFGFTEFYIADLDQIRRRGSNRSVVADLVRLGFHLILDPGVRTADDALRSFELGASVVVAALETLTGPQELARAVDLLGSERLWFSLDLRGGQPLGCVERWVGKRRPLPKLPDSRTLAADCSPSDRALAIAACAAQCGIRNFVVLDLAAVGTSDGVPTEQLCRKLLTQDRSYAIYTGGGVRGVDDLMRLERAGVAGVLVATALHNGALCRDSLSPWLPLS